MNCRNHKFIISADESCCEEIVLSLFHTLLFHRTTGKIQYTNQANYSIGTLGFIDTNCPLLDVTYVRAACKELDEVLRIAAASFKNDLVKPTNKFSSGEIHLEFFEKQRSLWPINSVDKPWEVWTVEMTLVKALDKEELLEKMSASILEHIVLIAETIASSDYVPKIPVRSDLELIFDNTYTSIQPYLHKIYHTFNNGQSRKPVHQAVSRMLKETFPV